MYFSGYLGVLELRRIAKQSKHQLSDLISCYFFQTDQAMHNHPARKVRPPSGVTNATHRIPVRLNT